MEGLVLELQRDALDSNIRITDLLRKALLVSRKLKIKDIEEWLNFELNGYMNTTVPEYRQVRGELKALNPYNGWIPVMLSSEWQEKLCYTYLNVSVSQISNLLETSEGGYFKFKYPGDLSNMIMQLMGQNFQPELHITLHQLVKILDTVRTKVMEFALDLESRGILGQGITFTKYEQQLAQSITYNTINIENMENSQIQQANDDSSQNR
ncbi:MAG: hypothetical protein CMJ62_21300 [Planctomycetaceae bacterium]|nr:hypothetical protein [Planctomycetaceae bacterium]|tara:strand:+ start:3990 stop:4616 length:627 start_codon:yes stop_codon:yes gene_type:complete